MRSDPPDPDLFRVSDIDPSPFIFKKSRVGSATLLFTKQCRAQACVNISQKLIQHAAYSATVAWIIFHMQYMARPPSSLVITFIFGATKKFFILSGPAFTQSPADR